MSFLDSRLSRLFRPPDNLAEVAQQVQDLRSTLFSAIQDIAVLKEMLQEKGCQMTRLTGDCVLSV